MQPSLVSAVCESVKPVNHNVFEIQLTLPEPVSRKAGQYCMLHIDGEQFAYSIASSPLQEQQIELHIRVEENDSNAAKVVHFIEQNSHIDIELPFGDAYLQTQRDKPILMIAGSTGFSGCQSKLLYLAEQTNDQPIYFYWGGRKQADLYLHERAEAICASNPALKYTATVSEETSEHMRNAWVHEAVLEDFPDVSNFDVYIAGSPAMVYGVYDALLPHGLNPDTTYSDVFAYAPRD